MAASRKPRAPAAPAGASRKVRRKDRGQDRGSKEDVLDPEAPALPAAERCVCGRRVGRALLKVLFATGLVLLGMVFRTPALKFPAVAGLLEPVVGVAAPADATVPPPAVAATLPLAEPVAPPPAKGPAAAAAVVAAAAPSPPPAVGVSPPGARVAAASGAPLGKRPQCKLIINSHAWYRIPLTALLRSMADAGFTRWSDVVVFFGGSTEHVPPHDPPAWWAPLAPAGVTFVNTTLNNYDFNAASGLYRYRDHPRVNANSYLYILDSSTVGPKFPRIFDGMTYVKPFELYTPPKPSSNTCAFGHGLVLRYRQNWDKNLTKIAGNTLEHKRGDARVDGVYVMDHFADRVRMLRPRVRTGSVDVYKTGTRRGKFYFPDFDLTKYILVMKSGDFGEGGVPQRPKGY